MSKRNFPIGPLAFMSIVALALIVGLFSVNKSSKNIETSEAAAPRKVATNPLVDVNRDGIVNTQDLEIFQNIVLVVNKGGWSYIYFAVDINHDGKVNIQDGSIIGSANNSIVTSCQWADVDSNGKVTTGDLELFSKNLGQINKDSNRYDINNDSQVNILDIVIAQKELGKKC